MFRTEENFAKKVANLLVKKLNCSIQVISAGEPQANGQAEGLYVKNVKRKMRALMVDASYEQLTDEWDESLLDLALQAVRCDPASSTGYTPARQSCF